MNDERINIPAGHARAALIRKRSRVKLINTHGTQVVDCWAVNPLDMAEFMSMEHTQVALDRCRPKVGDVMVTNRRRPILKILEDTCGVHDTLLAACDRYRYQLLGCKEYHRNCDDNLWEAMTALPATAPTSVSMRSGGTHWDPDSMWLTPRL